VLQTVAGARRTFVKGRAEPEWTECVVQGMMELVPRREPSQDDDCSAYPSEGRYRSMRHRVALPASTATFTILVSASTAQSPAGTFRKANIPASSVSALSVA
jgi:hypothetical protein